jgi:hypothetical protein
MVYDLAGRLIENRTIESNYLEKASIGSTYPSGVYSLIITQGETVKTVRIIKR